MTVAITVKGIHVKNSSPTSLVIKIPGGLNPTTLAYNQAATFYVEGSYSARFENVCLIRSSSPPLQTS